MIRNSGVLLKVVIIGFALWFTIDAPQPAIAGLLFPSGNPHPDAIPGRSGTVQLINVNTVTNAPVPPGPGGYYGDIEYAVFRANKFAAAFGVDTPAEDTPNGGVAAGEFVYAYQVYNAGHRGDITFYSAGLSDNGPLNGFPFLFGDGQNDAEQVNNGDSDYVAGTGQHPSATNVTSSRAGWFFSGANAAANLNSGEWSAVMFYTSPFRASWDNGSTTTGAGSSRIPAPEVGVVIPEPSSLVLVFFAILGMSAWRAGR
jgi:hypothetical protein